MFKSALKDSKPNALSKNENNLFSLAVAVFIALTVRWGVAEAYMIPSGSMLPTLLIHDHIFVNKLVYGMRVPFSKTWLFHLKNPERGEVIVFKDPRDNQTFLIKRIVGVAGDKIAYRDNQLYVNDKLVEARAVTHATAEKSAEADFHWLRDRDLDGATQDHDYATEYLDGHQHSVLHRRGENDRDQNAVTVPEGSLFVMGDHRDDSADSRYWGFAPKDNILGRASFVWLSCEKGLLNSDVGCDPSTVRWSRFFQHVN